MSWAMESLGLAADADARAVKRAYAARLKTTRPDDDPVAFQQLHETYQAALAWCARASARADDAWPRAGAAAIERAPALSAPPQPLSSTQQHRPPAATATPAIGNGARAERIHDPALEAELHGWQDAFDPQACAARIVDAARTMPAAAFPAWLRALPELWAIEVHPEVGHAVLAHLCADPRELADAAYDALAAEFSSYVCDLDVDACSTRIVTAAMRMPSPAFAGWMQRRPEMLSSTGQHQIGAAVLARLFADTPALPHAATDVLAERFGWGHDDSGVSRKQLHTLRNALNQRAVLQPDGDRDALAAALAHAGWPAITPSMAAQLRLRASQPYSAWRSFAQALVPLQPRRMHRFAALVRQWFPDALPAALSSAQLRFWSQIGNAKRPHVRQLILAITRGLLVALASALPVALIAHWGWNLDAASAMQLVALALVAWIGLAVLQFLARWQARADISAPYPYAVQQVVLPLGIVAIGTLLHGTGNGAAAGAGIALAYLSLARLLGRTEARLRGRVVALIAISSPATLLPLFGFGDTAIPWLVVATLLLLAPVLIDDRREANHSTSRLGNKGTPQ